MKAPGLVGIVNVTPDSFSDGGRFLDPGAAVMRALALEAAGAEFVDIGGESTRPGHSGVGEAEELGRLLPVLEGLRGRIGVPISVDTRKAGVMREALRHGAGVINDVGGLEDPAMMALAREAGVPVVLMRPAGVAVGEMGAFFRKQLGRLGHGGGRVVYLDPGVGFGTTREEDAWLAGDGVAELAGMGWPVLVGVSRKRIVRHLYPGVPIDEASAMMAVEAWRRGGTHLRLHEFGVVRALLAKEGA